MSKLKDEELVDMLDARVVHTEGITCHQGNGRTIDYFVVSKALAAAVLDIQLVADAPWKVGASAQHWPVRLLLRSAPARTLIRTLKPPGAFAKT